MLFSGEITLKRVNFINRLLSVGKEEVLRVLRVDTQKGFIDLSKKQVKTDEIDECKKKFGKSKAVEGIVKLLSVHTKKSMEYLYKNLIWPLYKTHEHAYDALKSILNGDDKIFEGLKITDDIKEELIKILKVRLVPQPVKIRSDFKLTCYTFEGIDAIKESLLNGEKKGTEAIPIKFRVIGSPLYECSISTINKKEGIEVMNAALQEVKKSIEAKGGNFLLETNPEVLGENEKSVGEQLREARNKPEEEEQEDEEDNNQEQEEGIKPVNFEDNEFKITK
jgi:translation initiation factor 2 subunit 1